MGIQTQRTIEQIRGRASVNMATAKDIELLLEHIDALEEFLEENEGDDQFGTEGWRHAIGLD